VFKEKPEWKCTGLLRSTVRGYNSPSILASILDQSNIGVLPMDWTAITNATRKYMIVSNFSPRNE
jgi:hypothetical protein